MAEHDPYGRQDTEVFPEGTSPTQHPQVLPAGADEPARRDVDRTALVSGVVFVVLAVLMLTGVDVSADWFDDSVAWALLIAAGVALLLNELRRARRRRT